MDVPAEPKKLPILLSLLRRALIKGVVAAPMVVTMAVIMTGGLLIMLMRLNFEVPRTKYSTSTVSTSNTKIIDSGRRRQYGNASLSFCRQGLAQWFFLLAHVCYCLLPVIKTMRDRLDSLAGQIRV